MNKNNTSSLFNQYFHSSQSLSCKNLMLFKYSTKTKTNHLYLMVDKKYGPAVKRNLLKRWLRVLYHDLIKKGLPVGLIVRPLKKSLSFHETKSCFEILNKQLQGHKT